MTTLLLLVRLALAGVLSTAAVGKLLDPAGSRKSVEDFGAPGWFAGPFARALPFLELGAAAALLTATGAWGGAVAALALMLLFSAAVGINLAEGKSPDCNCFGTVHSEPIGKGTLVRNLVLAGLAGLLVAMPERAGALSAVAWVGDLAPAEIAWTVLAAAGVAMLGFIGFELRRLAGRQDQVIARLGEIAERTGRDVDDLSDIPAVRDDLVPPSKGLPIGAIAPDFSVTSLDGDVVSLDDLLSRGKPLLLLFVDPNCVACESLLPDVEMWQRDNSEIATVALISRGSAEANRAKLTGRSIRDVYLQQNFEVAEAFGGRWTPSAVFIRPEGVVASWLATGMNDIRTLWEGVADSDPDDVWVGHFGIMGPEYEELPLKPGLPAPAFSMADLDGRNVSLGDFRGKRTMLLFWNPGCGFCQRMLDDVREIEQMSDREAPRLLVVSNGSPEDNRQMGLASPIILDNDRIVAEMYGSRGTPSALVVDEAGKIASVLAMGAPDVLALAGIRKQ